MVLKVRKRYSEGHGPLPTPILLHLFFSGYQPFNLSSILVSYFGCLHEQIHLYFLSSPALRTLEQEIFLNVLRMYRGAKECGSVCNICVWNPKAEVGCLPSSLLSLMVWGRGSPLSPELRDSASLAKQPAPECRTPDPHCIARALPTEPPPQPPGITTKFIYFLFFCMYECFPVYVSVHHLCA